MLRPDEETIDDVLTSLEVRLQGDEACLLVTKVRRLLKERIEEVNKESELERKELELRSTSESKDLQMNPFRAQQDLRKSHEKNELLQKGKQCAPKEKKSPGPSPLVHQLHSELVHTKAMREEDKKLIEKLRKKAAKYKAQTEVQLRTAEDPFESAKKHRQNLAYGGVFAEGLEAKTAQDMAIQNERVQKQQKKQIKELKKETESKDEHMEKMSRRILDIKKEKEVSQHLCKYCSYFIGRLITQK